MPKVYVMFLAVLCASLALSKAQPQSVGAVVNFVDGKPSTAKVPLDQLYASFFRYQQHLDSAAANHEKQGKDGRWLSKHFEHELGFTEADINIIRMSAARISEKRLELDAKAKVIVDADRAARKAGTLPVGAPSPGRPALQLLDRDKEETLRQQISVMNERLGPRKAKVLAAYLQDVFAGNGTVTTTPGAPHPTDISEGGPK